MPIKILAIDDSKTMRLAIKITFAAEDAQVVAVSKGSEAIPRAKQHGADIILIDHTLAAGEPSGLQVVQELKANPATAKIPVILMIPGRGGTSEADALAAGADGVIAKPFDTQELIDKVAVVIKGGAKPAAKPEVKPAAAAAAGGPKPPVATPPGAGGPKPPVATPAAAAGGPKPPVATPAAAAGAAKPPTATPATAAGAAKPPTATPAAAGAAKPPTATPAAAGAAKPPTATPAAAAGAAKPPTATPAAATAAKPATTPAPVGAKPAAGAASVPGVRPAATPAAATAARPAAAAGPIPIVRPIPFTAANAPTSGMLERLKAAQGGAVAGLDPAAVRALLQLSQDVVEQVVWEVVPDLAEQLIKERLQQQGR